MGLAVWTPLAEMELEDILRYIRNDDERPETARRIGQEILDLVERHATHSLPGHTHPAAPKYWFYILTSAG